MAEYIERAALLKKLKGSGAICDFGEHLIEQFPTADVSPVVHGRWVMRGGKFRCSVCDAKANWVDSGGTGGFSHDYVQVKSPWCHDCGAKMDGGGDT